jgi:hypothetical protein
MGDESRESLGKLPGVLADIRETELPGRRGGVFHYARAVYACFAEIQNLISEGFTLSTICKFLERKGILPPGADVRSFCRAFRREKTRRERSAKRKSKNAKEALVKNDNAVKLTETNNAKRETGTPDIQTQPTVKPGGRLQVNPDNTFVIKPIDFDGLPDFGKLTKRRSEV